MILNIVIPCYNEEEVLLETTSQLTVVVDNLIASCKVEQCDILYVDDGSSDSTWQLIEELQKKNRYVHGLKLAHNVGDQNALWAGFEWSVDKCDAVVSIDADLQHDIHKIEEMLDAWHNGYDVVYGIRNDRKTDSAFKKNTALSFYKMMQKMGVDIMLYNFNGKNIKIPDEEINKNMPLEFSVEPDTLIRVLMEFKGLEEYIEIPEQKLETPERKGFVVVEWGGTELK